MTKYDDDNREVLLARVASWYYEDNEGLSVIAKRLGRSVSLASRMVQQARELGLVEIRIRYPGSFDASLQVRLMQELPVRQAHVLSTQHGADPRDTLRYFGNVAADVLQQSLVGPGTVGVSWGTHVHSIVSAMKPVRSARGVVVQISGAIDGGDPTVDGAQMAQLLAHRLGKEVRTLHAPLVAGTAAIAEALQASPSIAKTLRLAAKADHLLIGVGSPFSPSAGLRRAGFLTPADLDDLQKCGAVGDIAGYHVNSEGELLDITLNRRIIGLHPLHIRKIAHVVLVGTGRNKILPILAAVRGGYVHTLITDTDTALGLLKGNLLKVTKTRPR